METVPTFLRFKWSLLLFVPFPLHAISSLGDTFFIIINFDNLKTERLKLDLYFYSDTATRYHWCHFWKNWRDCRTSYKVEGWKWVKNSRLGQSFLTHLWYVYVNSTWGEGECNAGQSKSSLQQRLWSGFHYKPLFIKMQTKNFHTKYSSRNFFITINNTS